MSFFTDWFGPKSKIDIFLKISKDLTHAVNDLKKIVRDYYSKLELLQKFVREWNEGTLQALKKLVEDLKNLCKLDQKEEKEEKRYIVDSISRIEHLISNEELQKELRIEDDILIKLKGLKQGIDKLGPVLSAQISFFERYRGVGPIRYQIKGVDQFNKGGR